MGLEVKSSVNYDTQVYYGFSGGQVRAVSWVVLDISQNAISV